MLMQYLSNQIWGEIKYDNILISYQSVTILGAAVALLLAFEKIHVPSCVSQVVSFFAPLAFSVYLIHDHPQIRDLLFINRFIWIAKLPLFQMIPCIIGIALAVFFICSFIDVFRQQLFRVTNLKKNYGNLRILLRIKSLLAIKHS